MTRGCKQGGHLSPIFFTLMIDEAIGKAKQTGVGMRFGDNKIPVLALLMIWC